MRPLWHVLAGLLLAARPAASRRGAMETGTGLEGGEFGIWDLGSAEGALGLGTPPSPPLCSSVPTAGGLKWVRERVAGRHLAPVRLGWDFQPGWGVPGSGTLLSVVFVCWLGVGSVPKAHGMWAARWRARGWCSSCWSGLSFLAVHTCADSRSARGSGVLHGTCRQGLRSCCARSCGVLGPGISCSHDGAVTAALLRWCAGTARAGCAGVCSRQALGLERNRIIIWCWLFQQPCGEGGQEGLMLTAPAPFPSAARQDGHPAPAGVSPPKGGVWPWTGTRQCQAAAGEASSPCLRAESSPRPCLRPGTGPRRAVCSRRVRGRAVLSGG